MLHFCKGELQASILFIYVYLTGHLLLDTAGLICQSTLYKRQEESVMGQENSL